MGLTCIQEGNRWWACLPWEVIRVGAAVLGVLTPPDNTSASPCPDPSPGPDPSPCPGIVNACTTAPTTGARARPGGDNTFGGVVE